MYPYRLRDQHLTDGLLRTTTDKAKRLCGNLLRTTCVWIVALLFVPGQTHSFHLRAQSPPTDPEAVIPPAFEVVSVKPHPPGYWPTFAYQHSTPDGFIARNVHARDIVAYAYDLRDPKVQVGLIPGAPKWMRIDWFDVQAKLSEADVERLKTLSPKQREAYIRHLVQLADRFNLKAHLVSKDSLAYELVVARNGPKNIQSAKPGGKEGINWVDSGYGQYYGVPLNSLVMLLPQLLGDRSWIKRDSQESMTSS
jgi:hypothetical protein